MLTIEIPERIRQLVGIAQMGEFPASCWATDIVSSWLYDVVAYLTEEDESKDPSQHMDTIAICKDLGIDHDDFVKVGGELYRQHAEDLLKQALGTRPNKEAFLQVSAMVLGFDILPRDRTTFELDWHNVVGGSVNDHDKNLPMPVWQCLMRYFSSSWRDPIGAWEAATAKYLEDHLAMLSYSDSELVPFPAE